MALSDQERARVMDLLGFCEETWAEFLADNIEVAALEELRVRAAVKRMWRDHVLTPRWLP